MAVSYKVLGQICPVDSNPTTLYTVPAATSAVVSTIVVANLTVSTATYRIAIRPAGETLSNKHYIAYDISLAANDSTTMTLGITMAATDVITVRTSAANSLTFQAFGSEIT
jgi:hypothetical protein